MHADGEVMAARYALESTPPTDLLHCAVTTTRRKTLRYRNDSPLNLKNKKESLRISLGDFTLTHQIM